LKVFIPLFQATYPVLIEILFSFLIFIGSYLVLPQSQTYIVGIQIGITTPVLHAIPLINPIVTIWTNKPYRETVIKWFRFKWKVQPVGGYMGGTK
jgi:hypothetical protein